LPGTKHSSLLLKSVNYGRKKCYSTGPRALPLIFLPVFVAEDSRRQHGVQEVRQEGGGGDHPQRRLRLPPGLLQVLRLQGRPLEPGANFIKLFFFLAFERTDKLECLSLLGLSNLV
jgi:hypothetical protein